MSKSIVCENKALYQYIAAIPVFENVLLHYHANLSLEVVLRVRNCTHGCVPGYSNVQIFNEKAYAEGEEYADDYAN